MDFRVLLGFTKQLAFSCLLPLFIISSKDLSISCEETVNREIKYYAVINLSGLYWYYQHCYTCLLRGVVLDFHHVNDSCTCILNIMLKKIVDEKGELLKYFIMTTSTDLPLALCSIPDNVYVPVGSLNVTSGPHDRYQNRGKRGQFQAMSADKIFLEIKKIGVHRCPRN